ncbi:MAG TPA: carbohydrate kinase family protein [Levilinea sp.]|nr:carbohydrate kinase family protein [Levilinea sp.]
MRPLPAVVAGHICVDVIPVLDHLPYGQFMQLFQPGRLVVSGPATFSTGGAVSNTGLALHRLGVPTRLVARVGCDPFAQIVRGIVDSYSSDLSAGMVSSDSATSYTIIINPPGIDRIFIHHPGANDAFRGNDVNFELVAQAALFHFGYPPMMQQMYANSGAELVELMRRVKETGATTSLDMTFPDPTSPGGQANWRAILKAVLPYVDIFLPSIEEMLFMLQRDTYERLHASAQNGNILSQITPELLTEFASELIASGVKVIGLKLGERGMYLQTTGADKLAGIGRAAPPAPEVWANRELWAPCFRVKVAGTTGAGDAAIAGFLSGLLRGMGAEECLTAAVAAGACNVEAPDALSGVRSWEATQERIHTGWERHPLHIKSTGWRWDEHYQLWTK